MIDNNHHIFLEYINAYPAEEKHLKQATDFLWDYQNPCSRSNTKGHITGSGIVINDGKILLIKHRYIQEWFQPGGHIDDGETPLEAAIRELKEETGWVTQLSGTNLPIDIDAHIIPENPKKQEAQHLHIDFAYLLEPIERQLPSDEEPSDWFDINQISAPRLQRIINKYKKQ